MSMSKPWGRYWKNNRNSLSRMHGPYGSCNLRLNIHHEMQTADSHLLANFQTGKKYKTDLWNMWGFNKGNVTRIYKLVFGRQTEPSEITAHWSELIFARRALEGEKGLLPTFGTWRHIPNGFCEGDIAYKKGKLALSLDFRNNLVNWTNPEHLQRLGFMNRWNLR